VYAEATMTERIFTQNNLLTIRRMAEEGRSATEIAESIGSTPASVRVVCSHHKIKIGRGQPPDQSIVVCMDGTLSAEFRRKAEELQIPASVLATRLLSAIVISNIYEAVLDEEDESHPAPASAA
jgi:hypothetical protein